MRNPALPVLGAVSVLVLSACGGTSSSTAADSGSPSAAGAAGHAPGQTLRVATTSLGKVVVDGAGMTVYTLSADGPDKSTCASSCLAEWPAVLAYTAGVVVLKSGLVAGIVSTALRMGPRLGILTGSSRPGQAPM